MVIRIRSTFQTRMSTLFAAPLLLLLLAAGQVASAADYDLKSKRVNVNAFAEAMHWSALGVLEAEQLKQVQPTSDALFLLRPSLCAFELTSAFLHAVFVTGETDIDRQIFQRRVAAFVADSSNVHKHRAVCPSELLSTDAYSEIMAQALVKPRRLTQIPEIQASPEVHHHRSLKFDALGSLVLGDLLARRSVSDMNPIRVNIGKLQSEEKEILFTKCGSANSPCSMRIEGKLELTTGGYFVQATSITIRKSP